MVKFFLDAKNMKKAISNKVAVWWEGTNIPHLYIGFNITKVNRTK